MKRTGGSQRLGLWSQEPGPEGSFGLAWQQQAQLRSTYYVIPFDPGVAGPACQAILPAPSPLNVPSTPQESSVTWVYTHTLREGTG